MLRASPGGWFGYHLVKLPCRAVDPRFMRFRLVAAVAVAAALSVGSAGPTLAKGGGEKGRDNRDKSAERARPHKARTEAHKAAKARKAEAHARRAARFVAVGIVDSASGGSVTLVVKGGSAKNLRGTTQLFEIASGASVSRNGKPVSGENAIQKGDHAMVKGVKAGATYTAHKVRAQSRDDKPESLSTPGS